MAIVRIGLALTGAHDRADGRRALEELTRLAMTAESAGLDDVWLGDHLSAGPQPWLSNVAFMAYLAGLTRRVRLGVMTIAALREPLRLADDLATVDLAAGGRLSVCLVAGWRRKEFEMLSLPFEKRTGRTIEVGRTLLRRWRPALEPDDEPVPAGVRSAGDIDLWLGGSGPHIAAAAAELGIGLLQTSHASAQAGATLADAYARRLTRGTAGRVGLVRQVFVARTDTQARAAARPYLESYYGMYRSWGIGADEGIGAADSADERFVIGSPRSVVSRLRDLTANPLASLVVCRVGWPDMPVDQAAESITLLGTEVAPVLRATDAADA